MYNPFLVLGSGDSDVDQEIFQNVDHSNANTFSERVVYTNECKGEWKCPGPKQKILRSKANRKKKRAEEIAKKLNGPFSIFQGIMYEVLDLITRHLNILSFLCKLFYGHWENENLINVVCSSAFFLQTFSPSNSISPSSYVPNSPKNTAYTYLDLKIHENHKN
jgi:hypothetical protein